MKERKINILKEDLKIRKDGKEVFIKKLDFYVEPFERGGCKFRKWGYLKYETSIESFSEVIKSMGKKYEVTLVSEIPEYQKEDKHLEVFLSDEIHTLKSKLEKKLKRHTFWIE